MTSLDDTPQRALSAGRTEARTLVPFAVTRVGGLAASHAAAFRDPELLAALWVWHTLEDSFAETSGMLADAIHTIVPTLDKSARRSLLRLRRDLHNRRAPRLGDRRALRDVACADSELSRLTDRFERELQRRHAAEERLFAAVNEATARGGAALITALGDTELSRGIALASPRAAEALETLSTESASDPHDKRTRSALAYVVRAALKPGPLTTFTQLRLDFAYEPEEPINPDATSSGPSATIADALTLSVVHAALLNPETRAAFRAVPNNSHRDGDAGGHMLLPMYQHQQERYFWRRDDVVDAFDVEEAVKALSTADLASDGALPVHELLSLLPPGWSARRAIECRLITPVAPWTHTDPYPLATVAESLESSGGRCGIAAAASLRSAVEIVQRVPHMDARERRNAETTVKRHLQQAFIDLGAIPPNHATAGDSLYEEVPARGPSRIVDAGARRAAETATQVMRPRLFRSFLYDEVIAAIRLAYGTPSGPLRVDDIMEMLHRISRGTEGSVRSQSAWMKDVAFATQAHPEGPPTQDRPVFYSPSLAPPSIYTVLQSSCVRDGSWVLDQATLLSAGNLLRFRGLRTDDALSRSLASQYVDRCPGRPIEVTVAVDQNSLQRVGSGFLPQLRWPVESVRDYGEDDLEIAELRLLIDEFDRVLLTDTQDTPVNLFYSGVVPLSLVSGPVRNLLVLSDPWALDFISPERFDGRERMLSSPPESQVTPRRSVESLIVNRRSVQCAPTDTPLGDPSLPPHRLAAEFDEWRSARGLGEELYLRIVQDGKIFDPQPKPLWIAVDAPHTLLLARRMVCHSKTTHVKVIEALPTATDIDQEEEHIRQHAFLSVLSPREESVR